MIHGNDVSFRLVASNCDIDVPFCGKTLRDKYDVLTGEAAIEGNGLRRSLTEKIGATGGFTTPLTLKTVPPILGAMFGDVKTSFFVSETRNLYQTDIKLCAADVSNRFTLVEEWGDTKKTYSDCVCSGFELRIHRGEAIKAHLDIDSSEIRNEELEMRNEKGAGSREQGENALRFGSGERFKADWTSYFLDGNFYNNIYGATLSVNKRGGCKTVLTLQRVLERIDLPSHLDFLLLSVRLVRERYEERRYGTFSVGLFNLDLISDGTEVNTADAVIGSLRYAVSGDVSADVYEER
jgi:hypothetical protein